MLLIYMRPPQAPATVEGCDISFLSQAAQREVSDLGLSPSLAE